MNVSTDRLFIAIRRLLLLTSAYCILTQYPFIVGGGSGHYKTFFVLNSTGHEIDHALNKYKSLEFLNKKKTVFFSI